MSAWDNLTNGAGYAGTAIKTANTIAPAMLSGAGLGFLASAPMTFGLSAIPLAVTMFKKIRAGARSADDLVKNYQDAFLKQVMAPISERARTDPQGAQEQMAHEWSGFLQSVNQFAAENPNHAKVVDQMFHTPAFMNTAQALLPQNGRSPLDPIYTSGAGFQSQHDDPSMLKSAIPLLATAGMEAGSRLFNQSPNPSVQSTSGQPGTAGMNDLPGQYGQPNGPWSERVPGQAAAGAPGQADHSLGGILGTIFGTNTPGRPGPNGAVASTNPFLQNLLPFVSSLGSDIYGARTSANAYRDAVGMQTQASRDAMNVQDRNQAAILAEAGRQYDTSRNDNMDWLTAGKGAINTLSSRLPELTRPFTEEFKPPTQDDLLKDPGFLSRRDNAQQALERSAAAKGNIFTPGVTAAISSKIGENTSNEYQNLYDRMEKEYLNKYNIFTGNETNEYNKLAGVAGTGQVAAGQNQILGQNVLNTTSNARTNTANQDTDLLTGMGNAQGQGAVNQAAAKVGGVSNVSDDITSMLTRLMYQRNNPSQVNRLALVN